MQNSESLQKAKEKDALCSSFFAGIGLGVLLAFCVASVWMIASGVTRGVSSLFSTEKTGCFYSVLLRRAPQLGNNVTGIESVDSLVRNRASKITDLFPEYNDATSLGRWIAIHDDNEDIGDELRAIAEIEHIEEHGTIGLVEPVEFLEPGDDKTWNLEKIHVAEAHKVLGEPKRTVIVAVVDTGVDLDHPAIKDRLIQGRNIVDGNNNPRNKLPSEMHATHVSGTIVMDPQLSSGSYGVAYPAAKVMPVRVLNEHGSGSFNDVARGIVWAADNGAQIINLSLGGTRDHRLLHDAIRHAALTKKVIVVAAKGNSNTSSPHYPSDYPEVMAVTATDRNDKRAFFSNYGDNSCCAAPGHQIYSSVPGNKFMIASGTSMASPHTAASAALILSKNPDITREQVQDTIEKKGDMLETDKPIGRRINCVNFLNN